MRYYKAKGYKKLKDAVETWKAHPLFASRINIIVDAVEAHIARKYTLTVPTLLPLVEGIIHEFVIYENLSLSSEKKEQMKQALEHAPLAGALSMNIYEGLVGYLDDVYAYKDFKKLSPKNRQKLNRHIVLHGRQINYFTEINSLRAFLMLDALSGLLAIDEEDWEHAKGKEKHRKRLAKS